MAKLAAVKLLGEPKNAAPPRKELASLLEKCLRGCRRPAALWLLTWARSADDPKAMGNEWKKLVEAEDACLRTAPAQSNAEIVATLLKIEAAWLRRLGRTEESIDVIGRVMQLEKGDPDALAGLLGELIEQKDWKSVNRLAEQFALPIAGNSQLLYTLAEAQAAQGDPKRAEETARRAFALNDTKLRQDLIRHLYIATVLQQRGQFAWAKREFRYVTASSAAANDVATRAQFSFAEMLHDQGEDKEAAEVLQQMTQAAGANRPREARLTGRTLGETRSRMYYFFACHAISQGDRAKQREYLDKALGEDSADLDVLIACYHLPDAAPDYRDKIRKLIRKAADDLHEAINEDPEVATNYNQLAWLVGNTEGDLDEALQYSKKSLELSPDAGGYYDTLAHVYFAKGDYDNAVKSQSKAAEMDPHSGQIIRKLAIFRKKLEEKKGLGNRG